MWHCGWRRSGRSQDSALKGAFRRASLVTGVGRNRSVAAAKSKAVPQHLLK